MTRNTDWKAVKRDIWNAAICDIRNTLMSDTWNVVQCDIRMTVIMCKLCMLKLEISTAPTKAKSREPAYSKTLTQNKILLQRLLQRCLPVSEMKNNHFDSRVKTAVH